MNTLTLIQAILNLLPTGLTLTKDILDLLNHTTTAVNANPGTPDHTTAVDAIKSIAGMK